MAMSVARLASRWTCSETSWTRTRPRPSDSTLADDAATSSSSTSRARSAAGSTSVAGGGGAGEGWRSTAASSVESRWSSRTLVCSAVASTKPRSACEAASRASAITPESSLATWRATSRF